MLRKKQVITVVSIAAISFLIGTLFNMNFVVSGGKGKGKDEDLWKAISELQDRVNTIEEELNQSKMMRFVDVSEYDVSNTDWRDVTVFTWQPQDQSINALLYVSYYFEYSKKVPDPTRLLYKLVIWNSSAQIWEEASGKNDCSEDYTWNPMRPYLMSLYPNQDTYMFKFQVAVDFGIANVRNMNIFITVVDGMSAES